MSPKRMDRYIGVTVLLAILVVFLAFLALMTLFAVLEELREENSAYNLIEILTYVALTTPRRLSEVLPYVVFLGALIGLGSLASRSEIVIFRASGVSPARIFFGVAWPASIVFLIGLVVGEWVAPRGEELAESYKISAMQEDPKASVGGVIAIKRGYWYREGSMFMRVSGLGENGDLFGIHQFWYVDKRLVRSVEAARAEYVEGGGANWLLHQVNETRFDGNTTTTRQIDTLPWDGHVDQRLLGVRVLVEPRKLSLEDLHYQITYMDREGLSAEVYRLAFWTKIFQPLSVLGLALLALGFVLGPLREVGMGARLSIGIFAGLAFKYLQDLFAPMSMVYDLPPLLAVALPVALCWAIGAWGLSRVR